MRSLRLALLTLAAAAGGFVLGCGGMTPPAACSPANCGGCCAADGSCQTGDTNAACGNVGNACSACSAGTACEAHVCKATSGAGGGGGSSGNDAGATGGGGGSAAGGGGGATGGGGGATGGGGGATGGGGGATGGGGGGSMGLDAGQPDLDAGTAGLDGGTIHPPTIALTFAPACTPVSVCPGNEVGDWVYTAGCVEDSFFDQVSGAAMQANCTAGISGKYGWLSGAVVFDGANVSRNVQGEVGFHATIAGTLCFYGCSALPSQFPAGIRGVCDKDLDAGTCECDVQFDLGNMSAGAYLNDGGVITTAGGDAFDSCISGTDMNYRQTASSNMTQPVPGTFTLSVY